MLSRPKYDENGKKVLCEMGGVNSEMNMDIYVKKLAAGEVLDICEDKNECAVLLLSGKVHFEVGKINEICQREIPLKKSPMPFIFQGKRRRALPQLSLPRCLCSKPITKNHGSPFFIIRKIAFTRNSARASGAARGTESFPQCLILIMRLIQIWLWARCLISRVNGRHIRRITILSRSFITTASADPRASVSVLRAILPIKRRTAIAFA